MFLCCSWTTRIELPFKEELVSKDMAKKFDDVQPSLLLFLHRLRSISVEDEVRSVGGRSLIRTETLI